MISVANFAGRISFAEYCKLVAESSEFHLTLSRAHRAPFSNSKYAKKRDILSEKQESGMALKSVSLCPKAVMLTPTLFALQSSLFENVALQTDDALHPVDATRLAGVELPSRMKRRGRLKGTEKTVVFLEMYCQVVFFYRTLFLFAGYMQTIIFCCLTLISVTR